MNEGFPLQEGFPSNSHQQRCFTCSAADISPHQLYKQFFNLLMKWVMQHVRVKRPPCSRNTPGATSWLWHIYVVTMRTSLEGLWACKSLFKTQQSAMRRAKNPEANRDRGVFKITKCSWTTRVHVVCPLGLMHRVTWHVFIRKVSHT